MGGSNQLRYATPRLVDAKTVHPRHKKKKKKKKRKSRHPPPKTRTIGWEGGIFKRLLWSETNRNLGNWWPLCQRSGNQTQRSAGKQHNLARVETPEKHFSLGGTTGAIKLVAFAENSKHNNDQNKGQNFRVFQGSKWNYKIDYTLWVPLIIIRIKWIKKNRWKGNLWRFYYVQIKSWIKKYLS